MENRFYSNGKLLLTGEYAVLDGAFALALPTKYGQDLVVKNGSDQKINWKSHDHDGSVWFEDEILLADIRNNSKKSNHPVTETLLAILRQADFKNPALLDQSEGFEITTHLDFPRHWGLGTSSTLINNIAQWFQIDAFALLRDSFGGSGYDIACAQNDTPILYRLENGKPIVQPIAFQPDFCENLYFVYLNQKQDSKAAIAAYRTNQQDLPELLPQIDRLTRIVSMTEDLQDFTVALEKHETLMAQMLQMQTVKETLFPDFPGTLKSLGAWGGDFILAIAKENPAPYFKQRGYETVIAYRDMILL